MASNGCHVPKLRFPSLGWHRMAVQGLPAYETAVLEGSVEVVDAKARMPSMGKTVMPSWERKRRSKMV